ncbi:hypothetical protein BVRB_2g043180 [Beta vulgaris subsp. vulgaris]|nr:hypothetical protein BVRB_2g043180 [Beta vulgaris subsp. vulgaris]
MLCFGRKGYANTLPELHSRDAGSCEARERRARSFGSLASVPAIDSLSMSVHVAAVADL